MGLLHKLETTLQEQLDTKAPVKIPQAARKTLAGGLWVIALLVAIVELYGAIGLWQWGHVVRPLNSAINYTAAYAPHLGLFYYLSIWSMVAVALLLLLAAPSLKAMKKTGWDLLFYGLLIQAVCAVFQLFADGGGFFDFISAAIGTIVGAYLLFQVRSWFSRSHPAHRRAGHGQHRWSEDDDTDKPADTDDAADKE